MIRGLLERRQHQNTVLHFRYTEAGNSENLSVQGKTINKTSACKMGIAYLVCHNIPQKHDVTRVNAHAVTLHGVLDFVDDSAPGCLNTKDFLNFHYVVRRGVLADDAF